ncbi:MAG: alpha/beta hydrolase [Tepidisphaera sp.]
MSDLSIHAHVFEPSEQPSTSALLLLHGTGGDESDLLPLGRRVAPGRSLLSPRGNVDEHGALRFFRRLAEGVFDLKDLAARVADLSKWLATAKKRYEIQTLDALGFSNGANTIAALLLTVASPTPLVRKAVLLRAMVTAPPVVGIDLSGTSVLIISGTRDPIIPLENAKLLAAQPQEAGAAVRHEILPAGHELTQDDIRLAKAFLT